MASSNTNWGSFESPEAKRRRILAMMRAVANCFKPGASPSEDQTGEGVLTRRQAKIVDATTTLNSDNKSLGDKSSIDESMDTGDVLVSNENDTDDSQVEPGSSSSLQNENNPQRNESSSSGANEDHFVDPYLSDTVVAENSEVKAHVIKVHFQRMKNFM